MAASSGALDIADITFGDDDGFTAGQAVFRSTASRADTPITIDLTNGEVGPIDATLNVLDR